MRENKCMAVFAMLVVMAVFSSCGTKAMSISEAVEAINKLKPGGSITIVLNSDVSRITDELTEALADDDYLIEIIESEGIGIDNSDEETKFLQKYAKKVKLDLSKTKITEIGDNTFKNCLSLASVNIPNSITTIGKMAFSWCESLTSVTIPNSVTSIGSGAFGGCTSLSISVQNDNKHFSVKDGVLYNKEGTALISWHSASGNVSIPNSVTEIGASAFEDCKSLTSVTIPNSVTTIGDGAFDDCTSLTSVTIPNSVTEIGEEAFYCCDSLTSVTIPNSVTEIGERAFYGCDSLTSVDIPKSVEKIGDDAFKNCASLKSVSLLNFSDGTSRTAFDDNVRVTFANGTQYTWGEFWTYIEYLEYLSLFY